MTPARVHPQSRLLSFYRGLEADFEVRENRNYEQLVVPNGNDREPYHRWFHLKEAFSARLMARVIKDCGLHWDRTLRVIDPFAGSGTTSVAAAEMVGRAELPAATVYGVECNPFLCLLASSKVGAIRAKPGDFLAIAQEVAASALKSRATSVQLPSLSTFRDQDFFDEAALVALVRLRDAIHRLTEGSADQVVIRLLLVCLAGTIEPASRLRRDGRALRYEAEKVPVNPITEFLRRASMVQEDLGSVHKRIYGRLIEGDGRTLTALPSHARDFDLALFSPPYPNNIDYTEVYKLENWFLGFINNQQEFRDQRLRTLYSHPSILRGESTSAEWAQPLIQPLLDALPDDRYRRQRTAMWRGYFHDMRDCLLALSSRMRVGGMLVYVVGNSAHGQPGDGIVIAADIIIARLAESAGFKVVSVEIARRPRRRSQSHEFVRESVVFARKE